MYNHIGCYHWEKGYIHLFYSLDKYETNIDGDIIRMPASIMFMGTEPKVFTEYVKKKIIKEFHEKKKNKGYYYYYKGVGQLELIDTLDKIKKQFNIKEDKLNQVKTKLIANAI